MPTVTILVDNTVAHPNPKGLRGEWGFAAAIDDVLFDTGQSDTVVHNARLLGVPTVYDNIVLSHTHYDHTAGIGHFLDPEDKPTIYLHPELWEERYQTESPDGELPHPIHISIPYTRDHITNGADLVEHRDPVEVIDGVWALGEIPRMHGDAAVGSRIAGDEFVADPVMDDQSIAVETAEGTAVIVGCGHAGLRNTIEHAADVTGDAVRYVIGGTHLVAAEPAEIHAIADWLEGDLELFAGTHCTGFEAQSILARRLPDAFRSVGVGTQLTLPE